MTHATRFMFGSVMVALLACDRPEVATKADVQRLSTEIARVSTCGSNYRVPSGCFGVMNTPRIAGQPYGFQVMCGATSPLPDSTDQFFARGVGETPASPATPPVAPVAPAPAKEKKP